VKKRPATLADLVRIFKANPVDLDRRKAGSKRRMRDSAQRKRTRAGIGAGTDGSTPNRDIMNWTNPERSECRH